MIRTPAGVPADCARGLFSIRAVALIPGLASLRGRPKALECAGGLAGLSGFSPSANRANRTYKCGDKRQRDTAFSARPRLRSQSGVALSLATALQHVPGHPQAAASRCDKLDRKRSLRHSPDHPLGTLLRPNSGLQRPKSVLRGLKNGQRRLEVGLIPTWNRSCQMARSGRCRGGSVQSRRAGRACRL